MNKRTKDLLIAILALSAAGISIYFSLAGRSPRVNVDTYEVLGAVTAEETARLLGNKGQVLVLARDSGPDKIPSLEAELKAFEQTLKKHGQIRVSAEKVPVTPMLMMSTGGGVPPEQLFKALESHPDVGALVLFFGFPPLADQELETLKKHGAKIIVVSSFHPDYKRLLDQQAIHLAIVPRPDSPEPGTRPPRTLRERFDQDYAIIAAADTTP